MIQLVLTQSHLATIEREALAAYPNECCGILIGIQHNDEERLVSIAHPVANDAESTDRHHRFSISPKDLIAAEQLAASRDEVVLGYYHSHPNHPANPSNFDRQRAWPFYSYVIVSVATSHVVEMKCWQFDEQSQQFIPQRIARL
jgi:proteasome lid subunit RPN8/RPN11